MASETRGCGAFSEVFSAFFLFFPWFLRAFHLEDRSVKSISMAQVG